VIGDDTFLKKPTTNEGTTPLELLSVCRARCSSSWRRRRGSARSGPATSCGNIETKQRKSTNDRAGFTSPR
jgi:hypothetical protein